MTGFATYTSFVTGCASGAGAALAAAITGQALVIDAGRT
jgi:hypothetical protein